jgi:ribosomal protein L21E
MSDYNPDNWIILKMSMNNDITYKILAGWSGSYLNGDSWKLNSGITKIEQDNEYFYFHGYSGSVYRCHKKSEIVRMNIAGVLNNYLEQYPDNIKHIKSEQLLAEFDTNKEK